MPNNWTKDRLIKAAQLYADRYDSETYDGIYNEFINLAEDRLNRLIRARQMSNYVEVFSKENSRSEVPLPEDFDGARTVYFNTKPISYMNPEQLANAKEDQQFYYSIIGETMLLNKPASALDAIQMIYHKRLPSLKGFDDTNWLLQENGDIYLTAVCGEIESYVKNDQRANMFWARLDSMFEELDRRDWKDRWSGNPLSIKLEKSRGS